MHKGTSNRDKVYSFIRDEVLPDSTYHGRFLTEEFVAELVGGISRTPVREAFLILASEGLLQLVPRHGAFIPPVTTQEIKETLDFRLFLEEKSAEVSLASRSVPLAAMEHALTEQIALLESGDTKKFIEWDAEFHLALVRSAGNSLMTRSYEDLRARHIRVGIRAVTATDERLKAVIEEHTRILDSLKAGDLEQVREAIHFHIETTARSLAQQN